MNVLVAGGIRLTVFTARACSFCRAGETRCFYSVICLIYSLFAHALPGVFNWLYEMFNRLPIARFYADPRGIDMAAADIGKPANNPFGVK